MSRPPVSVVMPFAGDAEQARAALEALSAIATGPGDELILADNGDALRASFESSRGAASGVSLKSSLRELSGDRITVVEVSGERSPAHARNVGAEHAGNDWILFLDADCRPSPDLLAAYFAEPVGDEIGALAGEVLPAAGATLAARYGAARGFLSQEAHLAHPYRPRAVAANLLVRRAAFQALGGFYEGVRAAEDTDFSWRLQAAGWRLGFRSGAVVEHQYRATVGELRRQWRGYAAGRAWLARRYEGFVPEPAARRVLARIGRQGSGPGGVNRVGAPGTAARSTGRIDRGRFLALDALLAAEELRGFTLSNRPTGEPPAAPARVVLVAERFPVAGDPLAEFAGTLERPRVEAQARPDTVAVDVARTMEIAYREDDGAAGRVMALLRLVARHPVRCLRDIARSRGQKPGLAALAPAALRLGHDPGARLHSLGGGRARLTAARLAALTGRSVED